MVTLKRVPRKTKNESGKSLDRELSITSFFLICFNFKQAVNEKFHWKDGSCEQHCIAKHSCEVFLKSLA